MEGKRHSRSRDLENTIKADNASIKMFLDYASQLSKDNKFKEAITVLSLCAQMTILPKTLPTEAVTEFGNALIKSYSVHMGKKTQQSDPWSCSMCACVLVDCVTLGCGHSVCKKCLLKDLTGLCKKCGAKYDPVDPDPVDEGAHVKVTILVCELVEKYWAKELKAVNLRNDGNKLFQRGDTDTSLLKYTDAFNLSPGDHLLLSNRSRAYFDSNRLQEAVDDADRAVKAKPDWGKGYFRRGISLAALGDHEAALIADFQCLVLEESCSQALRTEINKVLYTLVSSKRDLGSEGSIRSGFSSEGESSIVLDFPSLQSENEVFFSEDSASDEESNSEEASKESIITLQKLKNKKNMMISKNKHFYSLLDTINAAIMKMIETNFTPKARIINPSMVKVEDFECSLCLRLLWQPITTACGHTFCRMCIDRSLDHKRECPLCKTSLADHHSVRMTINEFVEETTHKMLPVEYAERRKIFDDEMNQLTGKPANDGSVSVPVFVCTMSFPSVPCPLHVFEPRYRLMIRRTMEAGTREFGMCSNSNDKPFSDYGTMLEIRDIQYFNDGRSIVDTMGGRRFKVIDRGMKDGYDIATVEFMEDATIPSDMLDEVKSLHDRTKAAALSWFNNHSSEMKAEISSHYGSMPTVEEHYWTLPSGPAWAWWVLAILPLDADAQLQILCHTQLKKRLEAIGRIINYIVRRNTNM